MAATVEAADDPPLAGNLGQVVDFRNSVSVVSDAGPIVRVLGKASIVQHALDQSFERPIFVAVCHLAEVGTSGFAFLPSGTNIIKLVCCTVGFVKYSNVEFETLSVPTNVLNIFVQQTLYKVSQFLNIYA